MQEIHETESYKSAGYNRNRDFDISPKGGGKGKIIAVTALVISVIIVIVSFMTVRLAHSAIVTPPRQPENNAEARTEITDEEFDQYFYFDSYLTGGDDGNMYISDFMSALLSCDMSENIRNRIFSDEFSIIYTEVKNGKLQMHSTIYLDDYEETYQGEAADRLMQIQKITGCMTCPTSVDVFYNEFLFTFDSEEMDEDYGIYNQEDFETILYN